MRLQLKASADQQDLHFQEDNSAQCVAKDVAGSQSAMQAQTKWEGLKRETYRPTKEDVIESGQKSQSGKMHKTCTKNTD